MYSYLDDAIFEGLVLESAIATPYSVEENIKRGTEAMRHVITSHKIEPKAMYRKKIGWIGFEWGIEGEAPPEFKDHAEFRKWQKSGRRPYDRGGHGIAHIIAKRDWEGRHIEEFLGQNGVDIAYRVVEAIAKGHITTRGKTTVKMQWQNMEVVLVGRKGNSEEWLLTSYIVPERGYRYMSTKDKEDKILESADECASVTDHTTHLRTNGLHGFVQTWERQTQAGKRLAIQQHEVNTGWLYDL